MKIWHINTVRYYLVLKKNEIIKISCKWMELENIILTETTQN